MDHFISEFGHIYFYKKGFPSKINNRMANSTVSDETARYCTALFAKISVLVWRDETVKLLARRCHESVETQAILCLHVRICTTFALTSAQSSYWSIQRLYKQGMWTTSPLELKKMANISVILMALWAIHRCVWYSRFHCLLSALL